MWIHTRARDRGLGACSPDFFYKNGAIWYILRVSKYVIKNKKSRVFRVIDEQQPKLLAMPFSDINPHEQVCTKVNTLTFDKGGGGVGAGVQPLRSQRFFLKKSNEKKALPLG